MSLPPINLNIKTLALKPGEGKKNTWLVLLHANRIPPHAGMLIDGNYNSLTIKGHELNINFEVLLKTIAQKKIEALFIKIIDHPVFSPGFQVDIFKEMVKKFDRVKEGEVTCLLPIKDFFQEFYAVPVKEEELLFDFMGRLNDEQFFEKACAVNFESGNNVLQIPFYTAEELNEKIGQERAPFYND